jgi:hypothetical protein
MAIAAAPSRLFSCTASDFDAVASARTATCGTANARYSMCNMYSTMQVTPPGVTHGRPRVSATNRQQQQQQQQQQQRAACECVNASWLDPTRSRGQALGGWAPAHMRAGRPAAAACAQPLSRHQQGVVHRASNREHRWARSSTLSTCARSLQSTPMQGASCVPCRHSRIRQLQVSGTPHSPGPAHPPPSPGCSWASARRTARPV